MVKALCYVGPFFAPCKFTGRAHQGIDEFHVPTGVVMLHYFECFVNIQAAELKRLTALDSARLLADLRIPTGHRINDQYRVCFTWKDGHA